MDNVQYVQLGHYTIGPESKVTNVCRIYIVDLTLNLTKFVLMIKRAFSFYTSSVQLGMKSVKLSLS